VSIIKSAWIATAVLAVLTAVPSIEAQQQAALRVPTSVLERYVGEWVYPDGNSVTVRLRGDTLFREVSGQRVPFVPISETLFRLGFVFTAEFVIDAAGGATQILSDGTGVEFRLTRKGSRPAALPAPPPPAVRVPKSVLERYVGVYEYIPGQMRRTDLRIVVSLRGDTLIRSMGEEQVLTSISETRFRVAGTSLMVEFVVDDAGVTQVLGSGGQQMLARLTSKR
jgi:hypothetical protein